MLGWLAAGLACTATTSGDSATTDPATPFACPASAASQVQATWEQLPFAPAGDVLDLATSAADPDRVYAVSSVNGVYRSDDGGASWSPLDTEITHVLAQALALRDDPDVVLHSSGPLYRSDNGGYRWEPTGLGTTETSGYVRGLVELDDGVLAVDGSSVIYRSTDGGLSWSTWSRPDFGRHSNPYELDEDHFFLQASGDVVLVARQGRGVWRSADRGLTWDPVTADPVQVNSLGVADERVWFATEASVWWSEDRGESWTELSAEDQLFVAGAAHPDGALLFTTRTAWLLADGTLAPWAVPELELGAIRTAEAVGDALILGLERGMARSNDRGITWTDASSGLVDDDLAVLTAHSTCPDWLFVGTQCESGGYVSAAGGEDLAQASAYMHYVMVAREAPDDPASWWVTSDDRVLVSRDLGESWAIAVPDTMAVHFHGLEVDPWQPGRVWVGSVGSGLFADDRPRVYRTDDDGERWQDSSEGLPDGDWSAHALHASRTDEDVVLLGSFRGGDIRHDGAPGVGLFRSTDGGHSWSVLPADGVLDVAQFTECDGRIYAATDAGVAVSDDAGDDWDLIRSGSEPYLAVACRGDTVLALDQGTGIYRSDDRGESWVAWSDGETAHRVPAGDYLAGLAISADGLTAWVAIRGQGLWRKGL